MKTSTATIVVTGGNSGLGLECARKAALRFPDHTFVLACRNPDKATAAVQDLTQSTGNPHIRALALDLSSLASVRAFCSDLLSRGFPPMTALVCNAGINGTYQGRTGDGFDAVFQTNHLGHFLMVQLLMPHLVAKGRVVVVSSDMHSPPGPPLIWLGAEALAHPDEELGRNPRRYSYSKLCNLYFTYELDRRLAQQGAKVSVNAFNPGLMLDTNFATDKSRFTEDFLKAVADRIGSLETSSTQLAHLLTPEFGPKTGVFIDRGVEKPSSVLSYDQANAAELWEASVRWCSP